MSISFKTTFFGGFEKEEVVNYIDELSKKNKSTVEALNEEISELKTQLQSAQEENENFKQIAVDLENVKGENDDLKKKLEEAQTKLDSLEAELPIYKDKAAELDQIKDHIAEIEISAHKRTEEFRQEAIKKLDAIVESQQQWCDGKRQSYSDSIQCIKEAISNAAADLSDVDYSGFDTMAKSLDDLKNEIHSEQ